MAPSSSFSSSLGVIFAGTFYLLPVEFNKTSSQVFAYIQPEDQSLLAQDASNKVPIELKLFADRQYDLDEKIFVAEGNVKAYLKGAILTADRLEFDRSKRILIATGQITFNKGSQYLQANSLEYDFTKEVGLLNEVYGVLIIDALSKDLKFTESSSVQEENRKIIDMGIKEFKLKDGYNIKGGTVDSKFNSILKDDLDQGIITTWRFKTDKINITKNGWFAKKIIFTNDPLNPPQAKIEALDVTAKEDNNKSTLITFRKSRLILENNISIPLLRTSNLGQYQKLTWLIGYDKRDRDGFFVGRQFQPINLGDNFKFSLQPQLFVQRAIIGKTKSYIAKGSSLLSDKVETGANISDLFGLKANLSGSSNNWEMDFTTQITTFDASRFSNGYRYYGNLTRDFDFHNLKGTVFTSYRYKTWNGSLGQSDIYNASGIFLDKSGEFEKAKSDHEYNMRIGAGHFEAEAFSGKYLIKEWKNNLFISIKSSYPIYRIMRDENLNFSDPSYSSLPVQPGIDFKTKISTSVSLYSNGNGQALFTLKGGPQLTLGNYEKRFLDYTRLSIMPGITKKEGSSPFKFDNEVDLRTISLEFEQQIYGPFLFTTGLEYNIDKRSDNFGKSLSSQAALIIKRRAYGFGLFYQPYEKSGGIMFNLNGFSFNEPGKPFENKN